MSDEEGPSQQHSDFEAGSDDGADDDGSLGEVEEGSDGEKPKAKKAKSSAAASGSSAKGGKKGAASAAKGAAPKGKGAPKSAPAAPKTGASTAAKSKAGPFSSSASASAPPPPPPGGAVRKITTEREAEEVILSYLNQANRPYSAQNVFDNLHGAVAKAVVPRILDKLTADGKIVSKSFGKVLIYWPNQAQYGDKTAAEMDALKEADKVSQIAASAASTRKRELSAQVASLGNVLTLGELNSQLAATNAKLEAAGAKLTKLQTSTELVDPKVRTAVIASLNRYRKAWASRKGMVKEVLDAICEGMEKKPKAVAELVGIETDEDAKVNIKDFAL